MKEKKQATIGLALIPILVLIVSLFVGIVYLGTDAHMPILIAIIVAASVGIFGLGFEWSEIEKGAIETIQMSMQAILILMVIGTVVGTWILAGTVPAMIYYGLKILSPGIFLVATLIICSIVSLATGSSWTTAGNSRYCTDGSRARSWDASSNRCRSNRFRSILRRQDIPIVRYN